MPRDIDDLFDALARSRYRSRFRLSPHEREYLGKRGLPAVLEHAREFITTRLAPAHPANDGKQTPMSGHPVFVAQHATATCCRGCLAKWHGIPCGERLSDQDIAHVLAVIRRWLAKDYPHAPKGSASPQPADDQPTLFEF